MRYPKFTLFILTAKVHNPFMPDDHHRNDLKQQNQEKPNSTLALRISGEYTEFVCWFRSVLVTYTLCVVFSVYFTIRLDDSVFGDNL